MALIYFDSSALVKLVVEEEASGLVAALWDGCDAAISSHLAYPEVRAALAAATRNHVLTAAGASSAQRSWEDYWSAIRTVELSRQVERLAGDLAGPHSLSGTDAVHLASAVAIQDPEVVLAVWDQRLHGAARSVGLQVAPARLGR